MSKLGLHASIIIINYNNHNFKNKSYLVAFKLKPVSHQP